MTIQVSVLIWTLISFFVLMLVLDKLLFRPLLSFMDARKEKIEHARAAREAAERAHDEAVQLIENERLEAEKAARLYAAAAITDARRAAAAETAARQKEYEGLLADQAAGADVEKQAIQQALHAGLDLLTRAFADKLAS